MNVESLETTALVLGKKPRVLGTNVCKDGSCETVTEYLEGYHPGLGKQHWGPNGQEETEVIRVIVRPVKTFWVRD